MGAAALAAERKMSVYPCEKFAGCKRFDEIVVCSSLPAFDL